MNGLLFSLPGTPVIYYGDEIGMGDNIYLGDRNGVRTPMQWSPDRNAGFSRANPQRLYLPPIIDPEYHYESVNVETQQQQPAVAVVVDEAADRPAAAASRRSAADRWSFSVRTIPRCWPSFAATRTKTCWSWPTCRGSRSTPSIDLSRLRRAQRRSRCSAARRSREITKNVRTLLTLAPHAFYWFLRHRTSKPPAAMVTSRHRQPECRC